MAEIKSLGGLPGHYRDKKTIQTGYEGYDPSGITPTILANGGGHGIMVLEKQARVKVMGTMENTINHTFESANRVYDKS